MASSGASRVGHFEGKIGLTSDDIRGWCEEKSMNTSSVEVFFGVRIENIKGQGNFLVLDRMGRKLYNLSNKKEVKKEIEVDKITHVRKPQKNHFVSKLIIGEDKPYSITFRSAQTREMFCQSLLSLFLLEPGKEDQVDFVSGPLEKRVDLKNPAYELAARLSKRNLDVLVATFNMGNADPCGTDFEPWLHGNSKRFDVCAIGLQEASFEPSVTGQSWDKVLIDAFLEHFGKANFHVVGDVSMMDMRLVVFVRNAHLSALSAIEKGKEATGIGGVVGNKGGLGISFRIYETSLCFVSCHLAARAERRDIRGQNYSSIVDGLHLGRRELGGVVNQFDHVFVFGDLNYRVEIPREDALEIIATEQYAQLLRKDQLRSEVKKQKVFVGFQEAPITFAPTYRYNRGDRTFSDKKNQTPSYCDRILVMSVNRSDLKIGEYVAAPSIMTSDHSPVSCTFAVRSHLHYVGIPYPHCRISVLGGYIDNILGQTTAPSPYLAIYGTALSKSVSSRVKPKTFSPAWSQSDIPQLEPVCSHPSYLIQQYLIFVVRSAKTELGEDPILGSAFVPLAQACGNSPGKVMASVTRGGRLRGTLCVSIHVLWMGESEIVGDADSDDELETRQRGESLPPDVHPIESNSEPVKEKKGLDAIAENGEEEPEELPKEIENRTDMEAAVVEASTVADDSVLSATPEEGDGEEPRSSPVISLEQEENVDQSDDSTEKKEGELMRMSEEESEQRNELVERRQDSSPAASDGKVVTEPDDQLPQSVQHPVEPTVSHANPEETDSPGLDGSISKDLTEQDEEKKEVGITEFADTVYYIAGDVVIPTRALRRVFVQEWEREATKRQLSQSVSDFQPGERPHFRPDSTINLKMEGGVSPLALLRAGHIGGQRSTAQQREQLSLKEGGDGQVVKAPFKLDHPELYGGCPLFSEHSRVFGRRCEPPGKRVSEYHGIKKK